MSRWITFMIILWVTMFCTLKVQMAKAEEKNPCWDGTLKLEDIPIGDFSSHAWPLKKANGNPNFLTLQKYNTSQNEFVIVDGKKQYGHTGIDLDSRECRDSAEVIAIQRGKVVLAVNGIGRNPPWGTHMAIATRLSKSSEQIVTFHYAHMHTNSMRYDTCENVEESGMPIGKEGNTGFTTATSADDQCLGVHLHWEVRLWNNIGELNAALKNSTKDGWHKPGSVFLKGYWCDAKSCDPQYLKNNKYLDPYFLFTEKFREFECEEEEGCPLWARKYALAMRRKGIELGRYDGYFAMNHDGEPPVDLLTRREAARWLKVGKGLTTRFSDQGFLDIVKDPYIETLLSDGIFVRSEDECRPDSSWIVFCPSEPTLKGEFIRWIVKTFLRKEFDEWMKANKALIGGQEVKQYYDNVKKGRYFKDLFDQSTDSWHREADYILFAAFNKHKTLISTRPEFNLLASITKLEAAKVMMLARDYALGEEYEDCDELVCDLNHKCDTELIITPSDDELDILLIGCEALPGCETGLCEKFTGELGGGSIEEPACPDFVCNPGEEKQQPCGMAGVQTQTCNSDCQWDPWGSCEDQGTCSPGESAMCGNCGIMTCRSDGTWGTCQNEGRCTSGESQTRVCGTNGTQSSTCNDNCQWEPWSTCQEACVCSSGQCCDGCNFSPSTQLCNNWYDYRCQGPNPGQDVEQSYGAVYCSGVDAGCNGEETHSPWSVLYDCSSNEVCDVNTRSCIPAPSSCGASSYWSPPSTSETDTTGLQATGSHPIPLRVEVREDFEGGSGLEARVCKGESTFSENIAFYITAFEGGILEDATLATRGRQCSDWLDILGTDTYREGKTFNGVWHIVSPATSRDDWYFPSSTCNSKPNAGGTCWSGYSLELTRTCR